jgi:hypothetical protein
LGRPSSARGAVNIYVRDEVLHIERRRWSLGRELDDLVFSVSTADIAELVTSSSGDIHADRIAVRNLRLRT